MSKTSRFLVLQPMITVLREALRRTWTMEWHGSKKPIVTRFYGRRKIIPRHDLTDVFENTPHITPNFRGLLALDPDKCTSCGRCARTCPNKCIELVPIDPQPPDWNKPKPKTFPSYFSGRCMYCGLCVDSCRYGALYHTQFFDGSETELEALVYPYEQLIDMHKQHQDCLSQGEECAYPIVQIPPEKEETATEED